MDRELKNIIKLKLTLPITVQQKSIMQRLEYALKPFAEIDRAITARSPETKLILGNAVQQMMVGLSVQDVLVAQKALRRIRIRQKETLAFFIRNNIFLTLALKPFADTVLPVLGYPDGKIYALDYEGRIVYAIDIKSFSLAKEVCTAILI